MVTAVIYHPQKKKCLILQRSKKEIAHPGLWGVAGGKLEWEDLQNNPITRMNHDIPNWQGMAEKLIAREVREESGLEITDPRYLESVVFIRPDGIPVVCLQFAVKWKSGKVEIAPEFDDYAWVDGEEVKKYDCIQGVPEEVDQAIKIYSQ